MRLLSLSSFAIAMTFAGLGSTVHASDSDPLKRAGSLGTKLGPVEKADRDQQKSLPEGVGVKILEVIPESAAAEAGLKPGDIVVASNSESVKMPGAFAASVSKLREGDKLRVDFIRDGESKSIDVTLKARPKETGTDSYDVIYGSVSIPAGRLRTIMTRPKQQPGAEAKKLPALMLIQGVGGYSVEIRPGAYGYAPMIEAFSKAGFVTMRIEKPGQGDSEGGPTSEVDFDTELAGYLAGLKALKTTEFVDGDNLFLFGHSMGGVMAPLIAKEVPVKGIAVYGTVVKTWPEYMLENVRRQSELAGESPATVDEALRKDAALSYLLFLTDKTPKEVANEHPELAERIAEFFADGEHYVGRSHRFFKQLARKNMPDAWEGFDGHVLSVWGRSDFVSAEDDHARIAAIVDSRNPGHGKFVAMDGLDHGMFKAATPMDSFRTQGSSGDYDPAYHELLLQWAKELSQPAKADQA